MKLSTGDFFDRWVILHQKATFDTTAASELELFNKELDLLLKEEKFRQTISSVEFFRQLTLLSVTNAKIWENEAAIRQSYKDDPANDKQLTLEEIGRRTLIIRDHNKIRVASKNKINELFGELKDNKINHQSA